jgi:hypothetical protein
MKPTDIDLCRSFTPLVGVFGHTEAELAASLLVRACQVQGDQWQDVDCRALGAVIKADLEIQREPFHSMNGNPFCRPDVHDLVKRGFAEWVDPLRVVRFTQAGLAALQKFAERSP